jgi:hypothetical protein
MWKESLRSSGSAFTGKEGRKETEDSVEGGGQTIDDRSRRERAGKIAHRHAEGYSCPPCTIRVKVAQHSTS